MRTFPTPPTRRPLCPSRRAAPCLVVSPHLDDAVFSCGMLLASRPGSIVCTVFSGGPVPPQRTPWDLSAGHRDSNEAMRSRFMEDDHALAVVGAHPVRLPFLDSQYGATPSAADIARALADVWRRSGAPPLVAPLGLYHSDHLLVGDACRLMVRELRLSNVLIYEDALYRTIRDVARQRYARLAQEGFRLEAVSGADARTLSLTRPGAANAKWRAVHAYRSQLRALADSHPYDLAEPERYRRLVLNRPARPPS